MAVDEPEAEEKRRAAEAAQTQPAAQQPSQITKAYEAKTKPVIDIGAPWVKFVIFILVMIAVAFFLGILPAIGIGVVLLLVYGFATGGINLSKLTPKNVIAIFLVLLIIGIPIYYIYFAERELGEGWLTELVQDIISLPARFAAWWTEHSPVQAFGRFYEKQVAIATGDFYTGTVDANAEEELGVFLENIEPASKYFYETENAVLWATVRARTLETTKPLNISFSCHAQDIGTKINGTVEPPEVKGVFLEDIDINCKFLSGKLGSGTKPVTIKADFDFTTLSYLKNYFMNRESLQALKRRNIDPFLQYGITDTNPIAVYTAGPVGVGMDTTAPLLGISPAYPVQPRLGVTLDNKWRGKIKKLNDLTIKVPEGMTLTGCDFNIEPVDGTEEERECEGGVCRYTKVYKMKKSEGGRMGLDRVKDITAFISFRCRIAIEPGAIPDILGRVPVATHFFKVTADYTYELDRTATI
ncbi:hypothetical protein KY339_06035, partial [Candidatus Woesearchaeota archaeon]|nr:hypothetical protein [Candidatus Woesearchaeota archaeon]